MRPILRNIAPILFLPLVLAACAPRPSVEPAPAVASATVAPQGPDDPVHAHLKQGKALQQQGQATAALEAFRSAYASLAPDSPASLRGVVLNDLGEALIATQNYAEAIPVCHSALLVNLSCNNTIEAAISHLYLGDAVERHGNLSVAREHWVKAYELAIRMGHVGLIRAARSRPLAPLTQF